VAQDSREVPLELTHVKEAIVVDGVMSDEGWQNAPVLPSTMYTPVFNGAVTERSELRVVYDDANIYVGGWFYDSNPKGIRINSLYRDRWNGDDTLAIYIDAFNDNQNAKWFGITPAGMRFDSLVSDDGNVINDNWDGFWSASTTITDQGWFVEARIPFSTLGFQVDADGRVVMGLTLTRLISRKGERVTFPAIDPKFPFRRPSLAQDVMLRDVHARKPFYLTPYALAGGKDAAGMESDPTREIGVDARYPFSSNLTLDLTVNTDFAQVEADEQQVALDRFPLFYPERRRFFQEGAGLFDFVTANNTRLFHSRRIGLGPDAQPVRILGGARLVGRLGGWDVGLLEMQTDTTRYSILGNRYSELPGENFGVVRLRRQILNPTSTAGLMMTTYYGGGRYNLGLGGDTTLRVKGDDYLIFKAASVVDEEERSGANFASRSIFDARWERRTGRGLAYNWQFARAGEDYKPELGFIPRRNFTTANVGGNWFFFTDKNKYFRRVFPGGLAYSTFRNADKALESGQYAFWLQWDTKAGGGGWVEPKWFRENVLVPFTIGRGITIPAGVHDFADLQLVYTMPTGSRLRTNVDFRSGTYFDGNRTQVIADPTWNASKHLELGASYQWTRLRFDSRSQKDTIQLLGLRVRTALNTRASGNAFIQFNSTSQRVDVNVRLRYNFAEGTDLWLVYNEGLDAERDRPGLDLPLSPLSLSRAFIVKYSHTLAF
jgi:Domain of unknown function (DUF5916)/Carbohydrate family 9 binding domain-like